MDTTSTLSPVRSIALALTLIVALLAGFVLTTAHRASAMVIWCSGDPLVLVNGNPVDVTVAVPKDSVGQIHDVTVTYHVPSNAVFSVGLTTGFQFKENIVVVKDQPAVKGLLLAKVRIPVDVAVHASGPAFPFKVTETVLLGTHLVVTGSSSQVMHTTTYGNLNIPLL